MVVSELRGEKIDIIPYNDEPARFVAKALSPARVREVLVDDESKQATVIVPDDQLSLAIGREGQNARLAARLTGWRIDIKSETEFAATSQQSEDYEEESGGRCQAISVRGRRCPNAALPGSPFCGLPMHQALSRFTTTAVAILEPLSDEEIADLADPDRTWEDVEPIVLRAEELFGEQEGVAEGEAGDLPEGQAGELPEGEAGEDVFEPAPEAAEPDGNLDVEEPQADEAEGLPAPEAEERAS
jgi:N utilization substance protein A